MRSARSADAARERLGLGSAARERFGVCSALRGRALPRASAAPLANAPALPRDLFEVLPANCVEARAYLNVGELEKTTLSKRLGDLAEHLLERLGRVGDADAKAAMRVVDAAKLMEAARGFSLCAWKATGATFLAIDFDAMALEGAFKGALAEAITKVISVALHKAPATKNNGAVREFVLDGSDGAVAVVGSTLVMGPSLPELERTIAARAGGAGFGGVGESVAWFTAETKSLDGAWTGGEEGVLTVRGPPSALDAGDVPDALRRIQSRFDDWGPRLEPQIPGATLTLKGMKLRADGERWSLELATTVHEVTQFITLYVQSFGARD